MTGRRCHSARADLRAADDPTRRAKMEQLDIEALRAGPVAEAYDEAVLASRDIDRFCSSTDWIVPAHDSFHADHQAFVLPLDAGFVALSRGQASGLGVFYAALEAMWGLARPLVGEREEALGREAALALAADKTRWNVLWLGGLVKDGALFKSLVQGLARHADLRLGPPTVRHQASLDGGFEGWLGRRSPLFRKRIRQARRGIIGAGLTLEWVDHRGGIADADALFRRIHAVEERSWKGLAGTGFVQGDMKAFYARMVPRLAARGALRVLFARAGDEDVAVCFGGLFGDTYRGLQNSFDDRFRDLSLGNAMQAETIARLGDDAVAWYDLGSEMDYKSRWAEGGLATVTLIAVKR